MREADGLGPKFLQRACASCHRDDGRGPAFVIKTSPSKRVSRRLPPAVYGRGYLEAIADEEIETLAMQAKGRRNGIGGRIHRVRYGAELNTDKRYHSYAPGTGSPALIGRFGVKARIATLDEFAADALQNDMGLTSPLRPHEPLGAGDDGKPGVDLSIDRVNALAEYTRLLEIPPRAAPNPRGTALFDSCHCSTCHVPRLKTRVDYPIKALAGIEAPVFTDLLLHDMGEAMSDGITEGEAGPREFRTTPLMGLRFYPAFLHDGRAASVTEAIRAHGAVGSEATISATSFEALPPDDQQQLVRYVESL